VNREKLEQGIRTFIEGMELDRAGGRFEGDDLDKTPARVAKAWREDLLIGYTQDPAQEVSWTRAPAGAGPVVVRGISFASVCIHHLLPFRGLAQVAYLPGERLAGLSKIGRVVDAHARRLQTQERLTANIVATLYDTLQPRGVIASLSAEHTCMTLRGVRKEQSRMTTVATAGLYDDDAAARREILDLLAEPRGPR
jgi:GTP cyclohydrolase I